LLFILGLGINIINSNIKTDSQRSFKAFANLIAIPVFSFIATPLSLIGTLLTFSGLTYLSEISFSIANQSLINQDFS
jgi:ribosomal protein L30E